MGRKVHRGREELGKGKEYDDQNMKFLVRNS